MFKRRAGFASGHREFRQCLSYSDHLGRLEALAVGPTVEHEGMSMPPAPVLEITPLFAALFALIQVPLTVAVGYRRVQTNVHFLDGGDTTLLRRMRAHGNYTETVPMVLIAMAAAEYHSAPSWLLIAGGCSLLCGRALHYVTLLRSAFGAGRAFGMVLTLLPMATFGAWALFQR
jgi:uncharacterized membrane protein YecN with MAPEG domain